MSDTPHHPLKSKPGWHRIVHAWHYSLAGLKHAFFYEQAFRQEMILVVPGVILAWFIPVSALEKLALVAVLVLVLIVELLNSAIEAAIDCSGLIDPDTNLGENTRNREVLNEQAKTNVFPRVQAAGCKPGA